MRLRVVSKKMMAGLALAGCAAAAGAAAPQAQKIPVLSAATIAKRCDAELAAARAELARQEKRRGSDTVLDEWNRLSLQIAQFFYPLDLIANVAPDQATRDAAQACVEKVVALDTERFQSQALLKRVQQVQPGDSVDALYRKELLDAFEDSGATLPPAQRARVKAIREELEKLGLAFQKNINEDKTTVTVTPAEAQGLPESWLAARKRDAAGSLIVELDYPSYLPFMTNAVDEAARRRVWEAKQNQGGAKNLELFDRALALRYELAQIYGLPDYATLTLRRRMAGNPTAVEDFLASVRSAVDTGEARELAELRADKAALSKLPVEQVKLGRWDVPFHQERLRQARFNVDQEALRAYFPTEASVQYALRLAQQLYGIEFVPATVPTWHPDVRYYAVYERGADGKRGAFVGSVYLDLFPREGKYNHAAAWPVYPASAAAGRRPTSVLVTNLDRKGLTQEELETLLHEFGHVLHGVLSQARWADLAGTSTKRDFVEAPSQMFEEWAYREEPLALFAELCPGCPRLTPAQVANLRAAHRFGAGVQYARQWQYAAYDMALHTGKPRGALQGWIELERATPFGYVEGTIFPANFGHLLGGYAAGYYGYMWAQVLALDMLSAFDGKLLDPAIGRKYRRVVLEPGGERPPQMLVVELLGRPANADAFYKEVTGQRQ